MVLIITLARKNSCLLKGGIILFDINGPSDTVEFFGQFFLCMVDPQIWAFRKSEPMQSVASMSLIFVLPCHRRGFSWCYHLPRALSYSKFLSFSSNGCNLVSDFISNAEIEDQAEVRREAWKYGIYNYSHSTTCQGKNVPPEITCSQLIKNENRKIHERLPNARQYLIK